MRKIPQGVADYLPEEDHRVQTSRVRRIGSYPSLKRACERQGLKLQLTIEGAREVGQFLRDTASAPQHPLGNDLATYLGDVACAQYPQCEWQIAASGYPVLLISEATEWDVIGFGLEHGNTQDQFISEGLEKLETLVRNETGRT